MPQLVMMGVMLVVMLGVFDVCWVHQTTWIWCPYSWFSWFLHWMVLKGGAIMTYGLQMSSVSSVDSAVGALDHVGSSTFQYFSHCTGCPLNRACALFVVKELDLFLDFENT